MPSDDYAPLGGAGALKLKGATKIQKKKKKKDKSSLEKALAEPDHDPAKPSERRDTTQDDEQSEAPVEDTPAPVQKTESERRYEEVRRKRLLKMAESSGSRPEMLKTHKERVEELNTYLSKLSEHHDMPKIGPG